MTSLFPQFFAYEFFTPTILRIVLGVILIAYGFDKFKNRIGSEGATSPLGVSPVSLWAKVIAIIEIVSGLFLLIGFLTQLIAIIASLIFIVNLLKVKIKDGFIRGYDFEILLLAVALSLLFLGPGAFSIDLPL